MAARRKIVLHIGYGKTGSSAIQSALARNQALLAAAGILYPEHATSEQARRGEITSGNVDPENWFEGQVIPIAREQEGHGTILFSNEMLFQRFDEFLAKHRTYADAFDFEIVLFVREPFEKLVSAYQQSVKRRGFAGDIHDFAEHDTDTVRAAGIVRALRADGVPFRLFNYSALRREAPRALFEHLGVWDLVGAGPHAEAARVNRSLTAAELGFLRYVNQVFGVEFGSVIADALVHRLPDLSSDPVSIDAETSKRVYEANVQAVEELNLLLPESEQLALHFVPAEGVARAGLSPEQVEVIRSVFPSALTYRDGVTLRDIAMKYESGAPLTREDAIALMQYAQKARPHGRIIAGKLKEWRGD